MGCFLCMFGLHDTCGQYLALSEGFACSNAMFPCMLFMHQCSNEQRYWPSADTLCGHPPIYIV